jgi:hypothetical protein
MVVSNRQRNRAGSGSAPDKTGQKPDIYKKLISFHTVTAKKKTLRDPFYKKGLSNSSQKFLDDSFPYTEKLYKNFRKGVWGITLL